jgi:putative RNA 2'-phosphotransferase
MIRDSEKQRHELRGDLIRARYGHSLAGRLARAKATPPEVLLHGTSPVAAREILTGGLLPMGRQYVHLSADRATALAVGCRKHENPVVLRVEATRAQAEGVAFYRGNDQVWLADNIPPEYISIASDGERR